MDSRSAEAARTFLNLYSIMQSSDLTSKERGFKVLMRHLNEAEALTGTQNDDGELALDLTPILLAVGVSYEWLFDRLSAATGSSVEELTFELRSFIDKLVE